LEIGNWVPQVFYDLIGRIIPGASLLLLGFIFLQDTNQAKDILAYLFQKSGVPAPTLFIIGLLISYLVGTLLGAVGLAISFREWSTGKLNEIHATPPKGADQKYDKGHISYMYDAIQIHSPTAGSRLAKLRAETHMCRVLMIGFVILLVLFAYKNRVTWNTAYYQIVLVSFVLGIFSTYFFHVHLELRARSLLVNSWHLLKNPPVDRGKP